MTRRWIPLLVALICAASSGAAVAEGLLDRYDVDSLSAMATLIVKAEVGDAVDVRTRDGDCAVWDVTVLAVLHGDAEPKSTIRVAGIEAYRKGPGIEGAGGEIRRLAKGDVVYLFLVPRDAPAGYAMYRLTDADWKVIESGARLVAGDKVHGFAQYWPSPGPGQQMMSGSAGFVAMTQATFPGAPTLSVEAFEKAVRSSLRFVADLRAKLSANALGEADVRAILRERPAVLKREWAHSDYIPYLIHDEPRRPTTRPGGAGSPPPGS